MPSLMDEIAELLIPFLLDPEPHRSDELGAADADAPHRPGGPPITGHCRDLPSPLDGVPRRS